MPGIGEGLQILELRAGRQQLEQAPRADPRRLLGRQRLRAGSPLRPRRSGEYSGTLQHASSSKDQAIGLLSMQRGSRRILQQFDPGIRRRFTRF